MRLCKIYPAQILGIMFVISSCKVELPKESHDIRESADSNLQLDNKSDAPKEPVFAPCFEIRSLWDNVPADSTCVCDAKETKKSLALTIPKAFLCANKGDGEYWANVFQKQGCAMVCKKAFESCGGFLTEKISLPKGWTILNKGSDPKFKVGYSDYPVKKEDFLKAVEEAKKKGLDPNDVPGANGWWMLEKAEYFVMGDPPGPTKNIGTLKDIGCKENKEVSDSAPVIAPPVKTPAPGPSTQLPKK